MNKWTEKTTLFLIMNYGLISNNLVLKRLNVSNNVMLKKVKKLELNRKEIRQDNFFQKIIQNKEKEKAKIRYQMNREENCKKCREYYHSKHGRERYNKWRKKWQKEKYHTDVNFKLKKNLRSRLYIACKNKKLGSAVKNLGCSMGKFKLWIEMHWEEGMTWDNHNLKGWHIDHIRPLASFDLSDKKQYLQACHFSNLQPMWAKDNLSKSDKII